MHLNPRMQAELTEPEEYTFQEVRGQAICCLLAAHKMCQLALVLDLTDGKRHHLLRLRGNELLVYQGCTPKQVPSMGNRLPVSHNEHLVFSAKIAGHSLRCMKGVCTHMFS